MCGIGGVFGAADRESVQKMLDAIVHRGPDDEYLVQGRDFTLGARRLSIVDVEGGRQPLSNENRTIWAAQNGEIYNFPELYDLLVSKGHQLKTRCDTELLPHLYEEYGVEMASRLDGMFAVAIWDELSAKGLLIRDRTGKKPLYYTEQNGALYFASEIKCLLKISGFKRSFNEKALPLFLSLKHVAAPHTIFQNIFVLPPAHQLVYTPGFSPKISRYWSPDFSSPDVFGEDLEEELLKRLRAAVKRRLMGDVPIGFYLSGGIDSSLVVALASEISRNPVKTFTLTYKDQTFGKEQDRFWARYVAKHFRTEHHEEEIDYEDFPKQLQNAIASFDQPFAGVISTYFLSKLISKHVKVVISGDGADELFGSYLTHRRAFELPAQKEEGLWRSQFSVFSQEEQQKLLANPHPSDAADYWRSHFSSLTAKDPLNRVLEAEFRTVFPDQVLAFVDFLSMAHSLEVRAPFLDTKFIDFAAKVPGHLKISPSGVTKHLLKKAAARYFPNQMIERPKEGFLMPIANWLKNDLEDFVRETLSSNRLKKHGLFQIDFVQDLIDAIYNGDSNYRQVNKVYSLLVFQMWYEMYF